jgi:hypothetical protein
MEIQQDYRELLELLNGHRVDYIIIGAHALAFYGFPRFTGDLDILVRADEENSARLLSALDDFGFGGSGFNIQDFIKPDKVIQLGFAPVRIDILTSIEGVSWEQAKGGCVQGDYGGISVHFIGRKEFIANKRILGRQKDLADLEALGEK